MLLKVPSLVEHASILFLRTVNARDVSNKLPSVTPEIIYKKCLVCVQYSV